MITYGIIAVVVGLVFGATGFVLHLVNMKNMIDGDDGKLSGTRIVAPFGLIFAGSLTSLVGVIVAIVGLILMFS